jgi:hypothetical protein
VAKVFSKTVFKNPLQKRNFVGIATQIGEYQLEVIIGLTFPREEKE